jgi:hypothetical protein
LIILIILGGEYKSRNMKGAEKKYEKSCCL